METKAKKNERPQKLAKKPAKKTADWQMSVEEFNKNGCLINGD